MLYISAGRALLPQLAAAAAPERRLAGSQRAAKALAVHPSEHQHFARERVLHDRRCETLVVPLHVVGRKGHAGHRIGKPRSTQACFTVDILSVPKWNTDAAKAAAAP